MPHDLIDDLAELGMLNVLYRHGPAGRVAYNTRRPSGVKYMARVTDPTHLAALQSLQAATEGGIPRDRWTEWLIYADYLDETPDYPIKGTGTRFAPNGTSTRGELAARIRAAVSAERESADEAGRYRESLDLSTFPEDPDDYAIGNDLDPDRNIWHPEGDPDGMT